MISQLLFTTIIFAVLSLITMMAAYLFYKWKWKVLLVFVPLTVLHFINPVNINNLLTFSIPFIVGCIGGYAVTKQKDITFYILASSIIVTVLALGSYYYYSGNSIGKVYTKDEFAVVLDQYQVPTDFKQEILKDYDTTKEIFRAVPYFIFLSVLCFVGVAFIFIKLMFARVLRITTAGLEHFRLNDYIIFLLIGGWGLFILALGRSNYIIETGLLNGALVVTTFYFVQALGIIKFAMLKKGIPVYIMPIVLIIILSTGAVAVMLIVMLTGFGALDLWADFRKLKNTNVPNQE